MSRIYCTKKLKDFIGNVDENLPSDYNDLRITDWNAHLFFMDKKKCLIFVNNLTFYSVIISEIVKKDLKNIDELFAKRLKEQLINDMIIKATDSIESLFGISQIKFIKTNNNKKVIGRINDFVDTLKYHCIFKYGHLNKMNVVFENELINKTPTRKLIETKNSWTNPIQNLLDFKKSKL